MEAHIPICLLEDSIIHKSFEDPFKDAMMDYKISFHLLEDILQEKER